ncbi:MAG: hypothetical protein K5871_10945 [Lachnospiraceae bacterium]|nr:hypothetical protein [Lachnospiraceae bacterium]
MKKTNEDKTREQDKRYEKLGSAVMGAAWIFFALKFIAVVSLVSLVVLWILHKPLWITPVIGVIVFTLYRLVWRLIFRFIRWAQK